MESNDTAYYDLGNYGRVVPTESRAAQLWFNRGLAWSYSFNHEEGLRCFQKAVDHDPHCAMSHWGILYAIGPNYNKSWIRFDREDVERTTKLAQSVAAIARLAKQAQPVERALIEAIATRFAEPGAVPGDMGALNQAYAVAMRDVYSKYGSDLDIAALFAESLMCIRPRALWDLDTGNPTTPDTAEATAVLETAMAQPGGRDHPALSHLYIHLMEMSPNPERAIKAADRLRGLVPDGSHLQHMATHIDVACGDYRRGIDSNRAAMLSDDKYFAKEKSSILYMAYRTHTIQVLAYSAMMAGRSEDAITAAKRLPGILTSDFLSIKSPPMIDWAEFQRSTLAHVFIRFGRWEDILKLELPEDQQLLSITTATYRYARGIALGVLGRLDEARAEREAFEAARQSIPENRMYGITAKAHDVMRATSLMLQGELEYREGKVEDAFNTLREGIKAEDKLAYSDPPLRMQPIRHVLGALLLEQGHIAEAEEMYKQDLGLSANLARRKARLNNVWGWHGLYECYVRAGKQEEARGIQPQHDIAIASADVPVASSCFCRLSVAKDLTAGCC